jgi:RNA exonuclease 1
VVKKWRQALEYLFSLMEKYSDRQVRFSLSQNHSPPPYPPTPRLSLPHITFLALSSLPLQVYTKQHHNQQQSNQQSNLQFSLNKATTMGKGYKLTSASGDGPKQCAFFFSDQGCRNGANCKFSHEASANNKAPPPTSVSSSSVCSSESEGEIVEAKQAGAYASLVKAGDDSNPFFSATAPPPSAAAPPTPKKPKSEQQQQSTDKKKDKKRKKSDLSSPFDLGNNETQPPTTAVISSPNVAAAPPKKSKGSASTTPKATNPSTPGNFRNLNLPIASFSLPTTTTPAIKEKPTTTSRPTTPQHEPAQPYPLPTATPLHRKWHDAVLATRSHPNYSSSFDFSKAQQLETNQGVSSNQGGSTWITSRPYGPWCTPNPSAIAIDCEMCETRNPLTGMVDTKALCRLSVVNAENPEEVLLDTLVKPDWPVVDYRSWVNGIKKEDLEKVEFTLGHAQLFMGALVSDQVCLYVVAIFVG